MSSFCIQYDIRLQFFFIFQLFPIFFNIDIQLPQHHLLRLFFPPLKGLDPLVENKFTIYKGLFLTLFFHFIEIQVIYNVVLISAIQQNDSVIHSDILFYIHFHYDLSQDIEYSFLCYTTGSCCLSILYINIWEFSESPVARIL